MTFAKNGFHFIQVALLVLVLGSVFSTSVDAKKIKAPDFTLKSRDGKNVRLSDLRGQVVLLNFWASWCGPCRQEMPILDQLQTKYSQAGFSVLGVNLDAKSAKAIKYLKDTPVNFTVLYDPQGKVSEQYGVQAMPSTVIIDRDGNVRYLHKGFKAGYTEKYHKQIKALLRE
ncbi:MAG: TlpA disulfide reductase family protein [Enterobacterales bacterium]|nr:TlpA disulfide reductase family protein [Enterobacterales bacterium]